MNNKIIRIGSLNTRSIFKESSHTTQKEFIHYLSDKSLQFDILCLQEVSSFHMQDNLSESQLHSFSTFMFPRTSSIVSKHCAIICFNSDLILDDCYISNDQRSIYCSILSSSGSVLCHITNVYVPASAGDRPAFMSSFMSMPFISMPPHHPSILVGDFNMSLNKQSVSSLPYVLPFYEWLYTNYNNCFPEGSFTFKRGVHRSTIDFIFAHRSVSTRITNSKIQYLPSSWTDHSLLFVDLVPTRSSIGPGSWRFNPTLLLEPSFLELLAEAVDLFFDSISSENDSPQHSWESFKVLLKCVAQS